MTKDPTGLRGSDEIYRFTPGIDDIEDAADPVTIVVNEGKEDNNYPEFEASTLY